MIAIVNVTPNPETADPLGVHEYELRVNRQVITRFTHLRAEGLAKCLDRAAEAVRRREQYDVLRFLLDIQATIPQTDPAKP